MLPSFLMSSEKASVERARALLHDAAPLAAAKMISVMHSGDKDDAVQLSAAEKILSINGVAPKKESGGEQAKLVGAAVIAALVGMAKVTGLRGVDERLLAKVLPAAEVIDLPPELADEQDALV